MADYKLTREQWKAVNPQVVLSKKESQIYGRFHYSESAKESRDFYKSKYGGWGRVSAKQFNLEKLPKNISSLIKSQTDAWTGTIPKWVEQRTKDAIYLMDKSVRGGKSVLDVVSGSVSAPQVHSQYKVHAGRQGEDAHWMTITGVSDEHITMTEYQPESKYTRWGREYKRPDPLTLGLEPDGPHSRKQEKVVQFDWDKNLIPGKSQTLEERKKLQPTVETPDIHTYQEGQLETSLQRQKTTTLTGPPSSAVSPPSSNLVNITTRQIQLGPHTAIGPPTGLKKPKITLPLRKEKVVHRGAEGKTVGVSEVKTREDLALLRGDREKTHTYTDQQGKEQIKVAPKALTAIGESGIGNLRQTINLAIDKMSGDLGMMGKPPEGKYGSQAVRYLENRMTYYISKGNELVNVPGMPGKGIAGWKLAWMLGRGTLSNQKIRSTMTQKDLDIFNKNFGGQYSNPKYLSGHWASPFGTRQHDATGDSAGGSRFTYPNDASKTQRLRSGQYMYGRDPLSSDEFRKQYQLIDTNSTGEVRDAFSNVKAWEQSSPAPPYKDIVTTSDGAEKIAHQEQTQEKLGSQSFEEQYEAQSQRTAGVNLEGEDLKVRPPTTAVSLGVMKGGFFYPKGLKGDVQGARLAPMEAQSPLWRTIVQMGSSWGLPPQVDKSSLDVEGYTGSQARQILAQSHESLTEGPLWVKGFEETDARPGAVKFSEVVTPKAKAGRIVDYQAPLGKNFYGPKTMFELDLPGHQDGVLSSSDKSLEKRAYALNQRLFESATTSTVGNISLISPEEALLHEIKAYNPELEQPSQLGPSQEKFKHTASNRDFINPETGEIDYQKKSDFEAAKRGQPAINRAIELENLQKGAEQGTILTGRELDKGKINYVPKKVVQKVPTSTQEVVQKGPVSSYNRRGTILTAPTKPVPGDAIKVKVSEEAKVLSEEARVNEQVEAERRLAEKRKLDQSSPETKAALKKAEDLVKKTGRAREHGWDYEHREIIERARMEKERIALMSDGPERDKAFSRLTRLINALPKGLYALPYLGLGIDILHGLVVKKRSERTGKEFNLGSFVPPYAKKIVYGEGIPQA